MIQKISDQFGQLDIVVNNAGVLVGGSIETLDETAWEKTFKTNVYSISQITKAALPLLKTAMFFLINFTTSISLSKTKLGPSVIIRITKVESLFTRFSP